MVVTSVGEGAHGAPSAWAHRSFIDPDSTTPDVTLVVPVHDEAATVGLLVDSIRSQVLLPGAVVFVDGGSTDQTAALLRRACAGHDGWRLLEAGAATPGRARNVGIEAATTEWIALTDAGIVLDPHWLERLVRVARADPSLEIVWGHYEPVAGGYFERSAALAYVGVPTVTAVGPARTRSVASCLLRREVWSRAGGFPDLRAAEDLLFLRAISDLGAREAEAPEAVAWWRLAPTPAATFRRFRTYSRINAEIGEQAGWHRGVLRIYALLLPFVLVGLVRDWRWLAIPFLGVAARLFKSTWARREGRSAAWAVNPVRLGGVGFVLAITDAATFAGWLDAVRRRRAG